MHEVDVLLDMLQCNVGWSMGQLDQKDQDQIDLEQAVQNHGEI